MPGFGAARAAVGSGPAGTRVRARRGPQVGRVRARRGRPPTAPRGPRPGPRRWRRGPRQRMSVRAPWPPPAPRPGPRPAPSPPRARLRRPRGRRRPIRGGPVPRPRRGPPRPRPARAPPARRACARPPPVPARPVPAPPARVRPVPRRSPRLRRQSCRRSIPLPSPRHRLLPRAACPRTSPICQACRGAATAGPASRGRPVGGFRAWVRTEPAVADRARQPAGAHLRCDGGIGERRVEDAREVADHRLGGRVTRLPGQPSALPRHGGHQSVALRRQRPQRAAVQRALRGSEVVGERQEPVELIGPLAGQQVGQPCRARRPAQPGDGPRELAVARLPRLGHRVVARGTNASGCSPYSRSATMSIVPASDGDITHRA